MKQILWLIFLIVVVSVAGVIGREGGEGLTSLFLSNNQPDFASKEYLLNIASDINKSLPMMIDKETEISSVGAIDGELFYNYVMINTSSEELSKHSFIDEMKPVLRNQACSSPEMKVFWENRVSVSYRYSGNDNKYVGKVVITPANCGY